MKNTLIKGALMAALFLFLIHIVFSFETLVVQEGELVKLDLDAVDPDGDILEFAFSPPLDENGTWQTTYDDAGEYQVAVVVSDAKTTIQETVSIIVENVNRAPTIIVEENVHAQERDFIKLTPDIFDEDGDEVSISYDSLFDDEGVWDTTYDDAGIYEVVLTATDGQDETKATIFITIDNVNQKPVFYESTPRTEAFSMQENDFQGFSVEADDLDGDELQYLWVFDGENASQEEEFTYQPDFESSGDYNLSLIVSDGVDQTTKKWVINVENVNRAPSLDQLVDIVVKENQTIVLDLPKIDLDGDEIIYTIEEPFNSNLTWTPGFDDAGFFSVTLKASDGDLKTKKTLEIEVVNVDRPPVIEDPGELIVYEDETLSASIETSDPDEDEVSVSVYGLPEDASFSNGVITWRPEKDTVLKPSNFFTKLLGKIGLDKSLFKEKKVPLTIEACSNELCTTKQAEITIKNVNSAPHFEQLLPDVVANETSLIHLQPKAIDDDNDYLKYYFSEPFDKSGQWQTTYDDAGTYTITVGATDGKESIEQEIELTILNKNRAPEFNKISNRKVNEGETVYMLVEPMDKDGDDIELRVENPPDGSTLIEKLFTWTPAHHLVSRTGGFFNNLVSKNDFLNRKLSKEKFVQVVTFSASDQQEETVKNVIVTVRNKNLAPRILNASPVGPIQVQAGIPIVFSIEPDDPDGDNFTVEWSFGIGTKKIKDANAIQRTFVRQGSKKITVTLDDGRDETTHEFLVEVKGIPAAEPQVIQQQPQQESPTLQFVTKVIES